ncbi:hypothetical protein EW026_g4937 [Hermanssonia centrifuga]|uniref:Uncharacterized protein n=1 Tax=Hermanssonia centrifuga TaxID=98765 RepID=A0A4S4KG64_9APHY|nr:hypothetical protein EW026_g4937 [Hermanssonia centrifuga]
MPPLCSIKPTNLAAGSGLSYRPVAVFVGGTSGIGAGMARAFARHRNGDAHIILVGRNRAAAEEVIASFPKPPAGKEDAKHEFVECDVSLMRNVRKTAAGLVERLPKLNFLVLTAGMMTLKGRDETDEGIDRKLALHYYSRWRFTYDLMPLLQKAKDAGEDAKVMTVLSAGLEAGPIDLNDLGLKKTFSLPNAARSASTYNDLMVKVFAEKHPDMAFTHIAPGVVRTPLAAGQSNDWILKAFSPLTTALGYVIGISPDDSGEYLWHGLYSGDKGAFRRNSSGEDVGDKRLHSTEESKTKLWEHTLEETSL